MRNKLALCTATVIILLSGPRTNNAQQASAGSNARHNVIVFVADGLRHNSVNAKDSPTLLSVRTQGVHFANSHSLFPTFTTANASAIATGHQLGDTGDFSNTIWVGYATFDTGNFDLPAGTPTPFLENDQILADLADHYHGNYLTEPTFLVTAAAHGYNTASIGKLGPTAIQQIENLSPVNQTFPVSGAPIIIDDSTAMIVPPTRPSAPPLRPSLVDEITKARLSPDAPQRTNGYGPRSTWNNGINGTTQANVVQQQWFADIATKVVLPDFARDSGKPFVLLFWSRDPDGTQHNQNDSAGGFSPGINGPSSLLAVQNADHNLRQILEWLNANPTVKANTDVFVTSDHGFATISRTEVTNTGQRTNSESAKHSYMGANGDIDTRIGTLPTGFLAIDLALGLHKNLFDPDRRSFDSSAPFRRLKLGPDVFEHPVAGNGLIADVVRKPDGTDSNVIVAANGGSDLIYVPDKNADTVREVVRLLTKYDYVGGIFVDDRYGDIPGALPLSSIGLLGSTPLPQPAIIVALKVFYRDFGNLQTAVQVADTMLQEGQGMHGGFGRDSTFNNMAAIGPDFKSGFEDTAPVSNADIAPTLARILGFDLSGHGKLDGRVLDEALRNGAATPNIKSGYTASPAANGWVTILEFQEAGGKRYYDRACFVQIESGNKNPVCP